METTVLSRVTKHGAAPRTYAQLKRRIERVIRLGRERARRAVEGEKIRTAWEIGRLIHGHLLLNKDRANYGEKVFQKVSRNFGISKTELYYSVEFIRTYRIFPTSGKLTWSDYRDLLSINDETKRRALAHEAAKSGWTRPRLLARIKEVRGDGKLGKRGSPGPLRNRLIPKRGRLRTYRIIRSETLRGEEEFLIDLGFACFRELAGVSRNRWKEEDIVELKAKRLAKLAKATKRELFTYEGVVERVVDGDTLWVRINLGFGNRTRQKLRLRGIDAPELGTRRGKAAKRFLEELLQSSPSVVLTTSRSDKYDRYLTDLYAGETYVNQRLLDEGLARLAHD